MVSCNQVSNQTPKCPKKCVHFFNGVLLIYPPFLSLFSEDQNLNAIPEYFENVESYISVFEPLLFEECRSQLRNCWEEVSDPSNLNREAHVKVKVTKVEILEGGDCLSLFLWVKEFFSPDIWNIFHSFVGWIEVNLEPTEKRKMYQNEKNWRENDVAVLSSSQPSSST